MALFGNPKFDLLKITLFPGPLEDRNVTMLVTEEDVLCGVGEQFSSKCGVEASGSFCVALVELWKSSPE